MTVSYAVRQVDWHTPTLFPSLGSRDVHLWRANVRHWSDHQVGLQNILDVDEQARAGRFHFERDRSVFVIAHGLLRRLLGRYSATRPEQVQFGFGAAGKPSLGVAHGVSPLRFNLSHSADVILIGIANDAEIGVDAERWAADTEVEELAAQCFSPHERAELRALSHDDQLQAFFSCWSRKEAYIKATGVGITRGLDYFDVTLTPGLPAQLLADRQHGADAGRWQMFDVNVRDGYSGAMVSELPIGHVSACNLDPVSDFLNFG